MFCYNNVFTQSLKAFGANLFTNSSASLYSHFGMSNFSFLNFLKYNSIFSFRNSALDGAFAPTYYDAVLSNFRNQNLLQFAAAHQPANMNVNTNVNLPAFQLNNINLNNSVNTNTNTNIGADQLSAGKLFDNNTKLSITKVKNGSMPYLLIGPENVNPNEKLPVLVYLHGAYQKGSNPDLLQSKEYDPAVIMKKWNLKNFRGYIICPQLPKGGSWCRKNTENSLRNLIKEFESTHNVDVNNISLIGFSLGGAGALYMANNMSDVFKKAVSLSPYEPGNLGGSMKIPTKAYAGSRDDSRANGPLAMTKGKLKRILGAENCQIVPGKGHNQLPAAVFCMDNNKNGCSDVIEWLFS